MRNVLALLMALHGIAHLVGFAVAWRLTAPEEVPFRTTLFFGRLDVGDQGIRVVGLVWLLLAILFVAAAVGGWLRQPWWGGLAQIVAGVSLILSLASLPEARIGVVVNLVILAAFLTAPRLGWL